MTRKLDTVKLELYTTLYLIIQDLPEHRDWLDPQLEERGA